MRRLEAHQPVRALTFAVHQMADGAELELAGYMREIKDTGFLEYLNEECLEGSRRLPVALRNQKVRSAATGGKD